MSRIKVFTAVIEHKHGSNHYTARTEKGLYQKLAGFCRQWWKQEMGSTPMPKTNVKLVNAYFDTMSARGQEFLDLGQDSI